MVNLCSSGKLDKCKVPISYRKYTWIANQVNWFVIAFTQADIDVNVFIETSLCMVFDGNRRMSTKVKQIVLWTQSRKCNLVWSSENCLERRAYHQSHVDPSVFHIKESVILIHVDDCVIV